tara:strand:- start:1325 stop:1882 length:558 start_codon:yes stop_codon:yes gene_type:complete
MVLLDTPVCTRDWQAPDFTLSDPTGRPVALADQWTASAVLIAFICNHCPYVQRIANRLATDTSALLADGIAVLGVMSNDYVAYPDDAPAAMFQFAQQHGFDFPYLVDADQAVGRAYGAVCTPDFFGFNARGQLQYRGRLDDARATENPDQRIPELRNAMRQIAKTGRGPDQQHPSIGCSIKWRLS